MAAEAALQSALTFPGLHQLLYSIPLISTLYAYNVHDKELILSGG